MAARVSSATFVGRESELARIARALERARAGDPTVLLLAGDAGVGKTRLLAEVAYRSRRAGALVLEGGCVQLGDEALPFGPLIEILRGLRDDLSATGPTDSSESLGQTLAGMLPELSRDTAGADAIPPIAGAAQATVFEQFLRLLDRLAERAPILLAFEDIHWADRSTLDLLRFLVRNLRRGRIVLLATYRTDDIHRRHPLVPFLAELERGGRTERLKLVGFDRLELTALLESIRGARARPDEVERIYERSQGNPFYAEELLATQVPEASLPGTLREVLLARVASLSDETQELLRAASAAGPHISVELLARASGVDEKSLERGLREAIERHVLEVLDARIGEQYVFRHALVREALYEDLLAGERTRLHAAFARALADRPRTDGTLAAELAYHWYAARDLPNAYEASIEAGMAAQAIYAYPEATAHFERAIELWDQVPDAAARGRLDRAGILERASRVAWYYSPARALAYAKAAIALVDHAAEPARAGLLRGPLSAASFTLLNDADALAALREGVRLVPDDQPSTARALALGGLARTLALFDRHAESAATARQAIDVARQTDARSVEGHALDTLGLDLAALGDIDGGLATIDLARSLATAYDTTSRVNETWLFRSQVLLEAGRLEDAAASGIEAAEHAARHGLAAILGILELSLVFDALFALGRWNDASEILLRARRFELNPIADLEVEERLALLELARGDFDPAARRLEGLRGRTGGVLAPSRVAPLALGLAELALWQGDPMAARSALRDALGRLDAATDPWVGSIGPLLALRIRAEATLATTAANDGLDDQFDEAREAARTCLSRMRAIAEEMSANRPAYSPQATAWLATCEAEDATLVGPDDPDKWATARAAWTALGNRHQEMYALTREGRAALIGRDRRRAAGTLGSARDLAVAVGARPLLQHIDDLADRAGIRLGLPPDRSPLESSPSIAEGGTRRDGLVFDGAMGPAKRGRHDLTPREHEILALVAAGRTDGDIAATLFISKKTASVHVAHIKDKLGASGRVDIVTSALRLGLIEPVGPEQGRP